MPRATEVLRRLKVYLYLCCESTTRRADRHFVQQAYQQILERTPNDGEVDYWMARLQQQLISREGLWQYFGSSPEAIWKQHGCTMGDVLHALRCQLVRQLPPAERILDLGGAARESPAGALLWMGYPHAPREITIVDLPPAQRFQAAQYLARKEEVADGIVEGSTRVRYRHGSMTDLSGVPEASIDLVWSGQTIEHVTEAEGHLVFRQVWRVLKPGGYFCLDTPNRTVTQIEVPSGFIHPEHKIEYTVPHLIGSLRATGFRIEEVLGLVPMPQSVQRGAFDTREMITNPRFSAEAEHCYLFYVKCAKPGGETAYHTDLHLLSA